MAEYIEREALRDALYDADAITMIGVKILNQFPSSDVAPVRHGRWEDGRCSNCKEEAVSTSWDEPTYDYDWEENLRYSYTETHTEYHLTNYCPNCGAVMGDADA